MKDQIKWKIIKYLRQGESLNYDYEIILPTPLANWDVWDYWEKERVRSMRDNLTKDDILFDIGSETGWMSVIFAKFCKIFLIEPTKEFWPNIYQTWKRNVKEEPIGCFSGLLGEETNTTQKEFGWPKEIEKDLIDRSKYQSIYNHSKDIKIITLDDLIERSQIKPTALTIDTEGAELPILKGAIITLSKLKPKIWLSIHPDLAEKDYNYTKQDLFNFIHNFDYRYEYLTTDHEIHYFLQSK